MREECLRLKAKGAKGGKTKWDEIEAVRLECVNMLIPLVFLNIRLSKDSVSPITPGVRHTDMFNTESTRQ